MVETVIDSNEISLNGVRYPIKGRVNRSLISTMPAKVVMGDYTLADEQVASTWATNDQRGGMLCEEMDESTQLDRSYWSTSEGRYKGHLTLPTLATLITNPTLAGPAICNADMEIAAGGWTGGAQDATHPKTGTYDWVLGATTAYQDLINYTANTEYIFTCWVWCNTNNKARIAIYDGVDRTYSPSYHPGDSDFHQLTATRTIDAAATTLRLELIVGDAVNGYFDDAAITGAYSLGNTTAYCNFNNKLYINYSNILATLNAGGTAFTVVAVMPGTITDLVGPINSTMLIFFGDSVYYWYMSNAATPVFTVTDVASANKGIIWDGKAFKVDTSGNMTKTVTPNSANPVWADADAGYSLSELGSNAKKSLGLYRDANANYVIYAGTNQGLWIYDFADSMWLQTELKMPNHATSGLGMENWRDALFLSAGLDVHKYMAGGTATIIQVGLNKDDGLPKTRGGEIVKLIGGYNEIFALIDSTYEGASSISTVMSFDGTGWQCIWEASAINKNMYSGIVSSVVAHRLWFSTTDGIYYIPLQRSIRNPKKIDSYPYSSTSVHISPWFDAGWIGNKLALSHTSFCKDMTTSETIGVSYRIDHSSNGITSTWVSLGTINNTGEGIETAYTFGTSAVGLVHKAIQFRYALTGSSTKSPDLQYAKFKYLKLLPTKWGCTVTVDCNKEYAGNTPSDLVAALDAVVGLNTLAEFTYRDSTGTYTYYVKVSNATDAERTGEDFRGIYSLALVQP